MPGRASAVQGHLGVAHRGGGQLFEGRGHRLGHLRYHVGVGLNRVGLVPAGHPAQAAGIVDGGHVAVGVDSQDQLANVGVVARCGHDRDAVAVGQGGGERIGAVGVAVAGQQRGVLVGQ